jgi:hypothetical protein
MTRVTCSAVVLMGLLFVRPWPAGAQAVGTATISGTVADESGAVLPGVTVEASSPALIEKTRTVVTNEAGRYTIVNLRPGVYTVTFTLAGFRTFRQEGLELTTDFSASVNGKLGVGGLEEAIVVEAPAPVVDTQAIATPRIATREEIDTIPTPNRSPDDLMATLPGVTPGFFGSQFRGTQDSLTMIDGMRATLMIGAGPSLTTAPTNSGVYQEFSFSTAIDSAEMGQPGMRINLVPRSGGNTFQGSVFGMYTNDSWQSSNLDDELRAQGLTEPAKTLEAYDFNPTLGGPILRDRLWFQSTYQATNNETQVLNSFADSNPLPYVYEADPTRPGVNASENQNFVQHLTWQVSANDKIAGLYSFSQTNAPTFYNALLFVTPPPEATLVGDFQTQQVGGRWTRTQSQRLLFEASFYAAKSEILNNYRGTAEPWSARNAGNLPTTRPDDYAILDINSGRLINLASVSDANISTSQELRAAATYTTGSHNIRAGLSFFRGTYHRPTSVIGYTVLRYQSGLPNSVDRQLPGNGREQIDGDWGVFVQDRWTLKRLTVNAGLRVDLLQSSVPDQVLPASVWLSEQQFAAQDVLNYKDLSPRLGAVYDLFGNGKTAVKVALARFVAGETVALTGAANPINLIATTDRRQWVDINRDHTIFNPDFTVQESELGPSSNLNFGRAVPGTTYDPNALSGWFNRAYSWETNVSVQHELLPSIGITGLYYRRIQGNQRTNDNLLITPASYDGPFCVRAPSDPRLPDGGGYEICGLYDIKPTSLGQVQNFNTQATNLGTGEGFTDIVSGFEFTVNARPGRGIFLQGGLNFQKTNTNVPGARGVFGGPTYNPCDVIDNPETRFCQVESPYRPDFSISGSYMLPLEIQVSGIYQGFAGPNIAAVWNAPSAVIAPSLGRPLAAGPTATKTIVLMEPNQDYLPMRNVFNFRFSKLFQVDNYRIRLSADLYNLFNENGISGINTTYGPNPFTGVNSWMVPTMVTSPRQFRLSAQFDF